MPVLFKVGKVNIAKEILECDEIQVTDLVTAFERFINGDWGEVDGIDNVYNDIAITSGGKVVAVYRSADGTKFWITTEKNQTTVRLAKSVRTEQVS